MPADAQADRLLLQAVRQAPVWSVTITAAALLGATGALLLPAALGDALDATLGRHPLPGALVRLGAVLAATVLAEVLTQLAGTAGAASATARLRHSLIRSALALGPAGQRRFGAGDVTARLVTGAASGGRVLPALLDTLTGVATAVAAVVALALVDWRPAVTLMVGAPAALVAVRVFVARASHTFTTYQQVQGEIAERLVEALAGVRTIRACDTVATESRRVVEPLPRLAESGYELWRAQRGIAWSLGLLVPLLQVAVVAVGGFGVAAGRVTPGELLAVLGYATLALGAFEHIDGLLGLAQARAGARRVAEVTGAAAGRSGGPGGPGGPDSTDAGTSDTDTDTDTDADAGTDPAAAAVRLSGVSVRAEDGTPILDRVDLAVPPGAVVAVVGRSGAGKSTLTALVGRLIDPDAGEVRLDGRAVSTLDDDELRAAVAYAFERPALLGATVADAIGYGGAGEPDRDRVERAAAIAHADGFVRRLPEGFDTPLPEVPMSGGEAQRLGIARALAQDARLLVLDDATSNLDTATEAEVTAALTDGVPGRTRLVVAHRVATAARADLVAWLESGRLRAVAPHAELWREREYRAVFAPPAGDRGAPESTVSISEES